MELRENQYNFNVSSNKLKQNNAKVNKPKVLFISSYPPRECGIATYTQDLIESLEAQFDANFEFSICPIKESKSSSQKYFHKGPCIFEDIPNSFLKTAFYINQDKDIELVVIQHEFGFFAKSEYHFMLMCSAIKKPIIIVFHTVIPNPNESLFFRVKEMANIAGSIIVMTSNAERILINEYEISPDKIVVIPHGTHLVTSTDVNSIKKALQLTGRFVLTTFGLLSSSKNIETTLRALPKIIKKNPEVLFLILGKTHPNIIQNEGEWYRDLLEQIVEELKLQDNVKFINRYLELNQLLNYLQATDVYLFTSKDRHQAVSGTFSYAISCGCTVVSTPIPHALEVINRQNGIIIDFEDSNQLAQAVNLLLSDTLLKEKLAFNSQIAMAPTAWQNSSIAHALLFYSYLSDEHVFEYNIPGYNLNHIRRMTTSVGIIQFAKIASPDFESGYTLDDNARALIAITQYFEITNDKSVLKLIHTYFNFIEYCFQADNVFLNYLDKSKKFTSQNSQENLEDSNGRAIWALGYLTSLKGILPKDVIFSAENIIEDSVAVFSNFQSPRAIAFVIKGLYYQNSNENRIIIGLLAERLLQMYENSESSHWHWYEDYMTYGNSLLPEAMLLAYLKTNRKIYLEIAKKSFYFLLNKIFIHNRIKVISNQSWMMKEQFDDDILGGEQPIDVAYTIMALEKFYLYFEDDFYKKHIQTAFNWFLGKNHLHQIVYNPQTGGCYDGIEENNVNINQGAESTLSYLLSRLVVDRLQLGNSQQRLLNLKQD